MQNRVHLRCEVCFCEHLFTCKLVIDVGATGSRKCKTGLKTALVFSALRAGRALVEEKAGKSNAGCQMPRVPLL